jgi:hypothetical protein
MSLLLKALAQINSREPADNLLLSDEEPTAPNVLAEPIEVSEAKSENSAATKTPALDQLTAPQPLPSPAIEKNTVTPAVISLDSFISLAAELGSEIPTRTEEVRSARGVISEESTFQKLSAIDFTLQRLSDLCKAIDADVSHPALLPIATLCDTPAPTSPAVVQPKPTERTAVQPLPVVLPQVVLVKSPPAVHVPILELCEEYRILKDSIAARFPLTNHATLLFVDAGRVPADSTWLWALAASILNDFEKRSDTPTPRTDHLNDSAIQSPGPPKVLIVEAAGPESGIANALGLSAVNGLSDVLKGTVPLRAAIRETYHPQIRFLPRGSDKLQTEHATALESTWANVSKEFQLLLVAGGPLGESSIENSPRLPTVADLFFPLANGAVLCVELDGTPVDCCRSSKAVLEANGANLLGCIVRGEIAA